MLPANRQRVMSGGAPYTVSGLHLAQQHTQPDKIMGPGACSTSHTGAKELFTPVQALDDLETIP